MNDPSKFWSTEVLLRIDPSPPHSYFSVSDDEGDDLKELDLRVCNHTPSEVPLWTLEDAVRKAYSDKAEASDSDPKPNEEDTENAAALNIVELVAVGVNDTAAHEWISKLSRQEWNGFFHSDNSDFRGQLLSFTFNVDNKAQTDEHWDVTLEGSVLTQLQEYSTSKTCTVVPTDGGIKLEPTGDDESRLHGSMSSSEQRIITGEMSIKISATEMARCTFLLEQRLHDAAFLNQYRPPPSEFRHSRPKALWKFAATAVMAQVSARKPFSRTFWDERKRARGRFVDILLERKLGKALEDEEWGVYRSLQENLRHDDQEYYEALVQHKLSCMTRHG